MRDGKQIDISIASCVNTPPDSVGYRGAISMAANANSWRQQVPDGSRQQEIFAELRDAWAELSRCLSRLENLHTLLTP